MATCISAQWKVLIVVEEDESLDKTFRIAPDTTLVELMQMWKDEFKLFGNWLFVSEDRIPISPKWLTIEMMGETRPNSKIVVLKAELFNETANKVFLFLNEKCHQLKVKPQQKLLDIVWPLMDSSTAIDYDAEPLDLMSTVKRAGFANDSVIYESLRSVNVKLSSGVTIIIQMPSDSIVLQLVERVSAYEASNFSLKYQGRYLHTQERIKELTRIIEVMTADFAVHFNGRCVRWKTKREPMAFSEFLSELSDNGNMDKEKLEKMEFTCIGCRRRIWKSEHDDQLLPIQCCKEMSLTLNVMSPSDKGTNLEANQCIQSFYEHLLRWKTENIRSRDSRNLFRQMKEKCLEQNWDYNLITGWGTRLQRSFSDLENKIKTLEGEIEAWKAKNTDSENTETLKRANMKLVEEFKILKTTNTRSEEKITELKDEIRQFQTKVKELDNEKDKLKEEIGVKLFIFYDSNEFKPASVPEVEYQGRYWTITSSYIKCHIRGIRPGWTTFEALREALASLFMGNNRIDQIVQCLGTVNERPVVRVTSFIKDEGDIVGKSPYCDIDTGEQFSWEEAGKPLPQYIEAGGKILCGGRRRVVLGIRRFIPELVVDIPKEYNEEYFMMATGDEES